MPDSRMEKHIFEGRTRKDFPRRMESLGPMKEFVATECGKFGVNEAISSKLTLALEELAVNAIKYDDRPERSLSVELIRSSDEMRLIFLEYGAPFNPLEHPPPDITAGLEERPIGGLGIFLVTRLADQVEYKRQDGNNIVTLTMKTAG